MVDKIKGKIGHNRQGGETVTKKEIVVKRNEENPEPTEIIADAIIKISQAFERIKNGRLSQRALILLIQDAVGASFVSRGQIKEVLECLPDLKNLYIKKKATK